MDGHVDRHASVTVVRRIDWADTDMGGICWYPAFARLVDAAESFMFSCVGLLDAFIRLPRVALDIAYSSPMRFNEIVDVHYRVARVGRTSYAGEFRIQRDSQVTVSGTVTSALLDEDGRKAAWPDHWRGRLLDSGPVGREELAYPVARR